MPDPAAPGQRVCVAEIGAAHGLAGEVRLRAFTADPLAITGYGTLQAEDGRGFTIAAVRPGKDCLVARLAGVADRTAAERLRNLKLYVPRERLPAIDEPETYYHADLVGLAAVGPDGAVVGTVSAVQNFGASDLLEIRPATGGPTVLLPFTEEVVPVVDIGSGRLVLDPPDGAMKPSPLAGEGGEAKPSRVRGVSHGSTEPLTRPSAGQGRRRSTLSRKGRGYERASPCGPRPC
jgi:16S rRNA processing protein RimM